MAEAQIVMDAEFGLSHTGPLALSIWRGALTEHVIAAHQLVSRKLKRQYGSFGMLVVIEANAPAPTTEKTLLDAVYRDLEPSLFALALVVQGEGFRLGAVRALMTSVLNERRFVRQMFTDLHLACGWLVNVACERGLPASRQEICEAMETAYWSYSWRADQQNRPFGPRLS